MLAGIRSIVRHPRFRPLFGIAVAVALAVPVAGVSGAVVAGHAVSSGTFDGRALGVSGQHGPRVRATHVQKNFADPGLNKFGKYYYIYKTGAGFAYSRPTSPKGPFTRPRTAMPKLPSWVAHHDAKTWAPDVFRSTSHGKTIYVMYFTAVKKGTSNHCLGTAQAAHPSGPFRATDVHICADRPGYSTIDPTHFRSGSGQRYIVFKQNKANRYGLKIVTMKMHSAGLVPIRSEGRRTKIATGNGPRARIEGPSVVRHGGKTWIFTSRGDYTDCSYSTDAWSAESLWGGHFKRVKTVMNSRTTGLCGPGGATVINVDGKSWIAFHAWVHGTARSHGRRDTWIGRLRWAKNGNPVMLLAEHQSAPGGLTPGVPSKGHHTSPGHHSSPGEPSKPSKFGPSSAMVFATANIGRSYDRGGCRVDVTAGAMSRIKHTVNHVAGDNPRFIGWQEIDGADCGREMAMLKSTFHGWTGTDLQKSPNKVSATEVPEVAQGAQKTSERIVKACHGVARHSPNRFLTIARYRGLRLTHINTHFIVGAFKGNRTWTALWKKHWSKLQEQVRKEHAAGYDVVITADWNRRAGSQGWSPANVYPGAKLVRSAGIDNIVAVPAAGWKVVKTKPQGSVHIGVDSHSAQWVALRFAHE